MSVATKEQILKVLKAYNPWWGTGVVNPGFTKTYRRFAYYEAMKRLEQKDLRRTIVLTGTRRVGKTTIQYQMIDRLLKKGVPPQKILFVSMDHPMLKLSGLNDLLECYHSNVYAEQDCYYFFDEIQYASDWDKWMKTIYDMQPETKMVATGSASPALMKGSSESGAGRWSVIQVPTLSFYEYCALIGARVPELGPEIRPTAFLHMAQQERTAVMIKLEEVQNYFMRYLRVGGFPELALASDDLMAQQIMREDETGSPGTLQDSECNRAGTHFSVFMQCVVRDRLVFCDCERSWRSEPPDCGKLCELSGKRESDLSKLASRNGWA